jgi:hypothetical protein
MGVESESGSDGKKDTVKGAPSSVREAAMVPRINSSAGLRGGRRTPNAAQDRNYGDAEDGGMLAQLLKPMTSDLGPDW